MPDIYSWPVVPQPSRGTRSATDLIVIHTNEGPEGARSAEGLASYLQRAEPGYHFTVDQDSAVRCVADLRQLVWGAGGVNSRALHVCFTGYASQSSAEWHDGPSTAAGLIAADIVRQLADLFGVPRQRVTDPRTQRGICGHVDVSRYYPASQGHTDPGAHFPWDEFIARVNGLEEALTEDDKKFIGDQLGIRLFALESNLNSRLDAIDSRVAVVERKAQRTNAALIDRDGKSLVGRIARFLGA